MARHVALRVGVPVDKPAYAVNRLCGSGFQAIVNAAMDMLMSGGTARFALAGGVESMSLSPFVLHGSSRFGSRFGQTPLVSSPSLFPHFFFPLAPILDTYSIFIVSLLSFIHWNQSWLTMIGFYRSNRPRILQLLWLMKTENSLCLNFTQPQVFKYHE